MSQTSAGNTEMEAVSAFTRQSVLFDTLYGNDLIIQYKRKRVREHMLRYLQPGSQLLELNCGTGEDALYFAGKGFSVHATDISPGMLDMLEQKMKKADTTGKLTTESCSYLQLETLKNKGPFDQIYSNFGGLNCTAELDRVLDSLSTLLKPGGVLTLVIISKFCLWEFLLLFKGRFSTAFRRFFSSKGRKAHIEGQYFKCWYYRPSYLKTKLANKYTLLEHEGLCTIVPPSYIKGFGEKRPRLFRFLTRMENKYSHQWPWLNAGDYFIISFKKKRE